MNRRYQVGFGRIVTFTHDTPFIKNIVIQETAKSQENPSNRDSEGNTLTKEQMINFLKAIENDGEDYDLYNYGQEATAESILHYMLKK